MGFRDVSNFFVLEKAHPSVTCFSSEFSSKYFSRTEWVTIGMPAREDVQLSEGISPSSIFSKTLCSLQSVSFLFC